MSFFQIVSTRVQKLPVHWTGDLLRFSIQSDKVNPTWIPSIVVLPCAAGLFGILCKYSIYFMLFIAQFKIYLFEFWKKTRFILRVPKKHVGWISIDSFSFRHLLVGQHSLRNVLVLELWGIEVQERRKIRRRTATQWRTARLKITRNHGTWIAIPIGSMYGIYVPTFGWCLW